MFKMTSFVPPQYFSAHPHPRTNQRLPNHNHPSPTTTIDNTLAQTYYHIARLEIELEQVRKERDDAERVNKWLLKSLVDGTLGDKSGTESERISAATTIQGNDSTHQTADDRAQGRSASSASAGAESGSTHQTSDGESPTRSLPSTRNPKFDYLDFLPSDDDADDKGGVRKKTKKEDQCPLSFEQPEQTKVSSVTAPNTPRVMRWGRHVDEEIAQMAATKSAPPAVPQFGAIDVNALTQVSPALVRSLCASSKTSLGAEAIPVKPYPHANNVKLEAVEKDEELVIQEIETAFDPTSLQTIGVERHEVDDGAAYFSSGSESDSAEDGELREATNTKDKIQTGGEIEEQGPHERAAPVISASEYSPALQHGDARLAANPSRPSFSSAIIISNLPIDTSSGDILRHIRGGCIVSIQTDSLSVCNNTKDVKVIFLGSHPARDVVDSARTHPFTIGDRTPTITLIEEQVWLPGFLFHLARSGATRILRLKYLHPDITSPEWILGTIYQGPAPAPPDEEITFIGPVEGGRVMEVHFTGIEEAERARVKLEGAKFKASGEQRQDRFYVVEWGRDPCEVNVDEADKEYGDTESENGDLDRPADSGKLRMSAEDMADLY